MQYNMRPKARAVIQGGEAFPGLKGEVLFYPQRDAVLVVARVSGLPQGGSGFFGFHIHEGDSCKGEAFEQTGGHLNPKAKPHPKHMGDLPPLLSCSGSAYMAVKSNRFRICDVIGRTVIIHGGADDFHTQPSGDAGEKIACGVIRRI